jgi:hypothetical protein
LFPFKARCHSSLDSSGAKNSTISQLARGDFR